MFALLRKEIESFLSSLIGYIVIIVFLLVVSFFLWVISFGQNIITNGYASIDGLFVIAPMVFLFLIPAITMRMFAEEKKSGTIEMLLTKPLSDMQIILAKFFAGVILVVFALLPTLIYYYSVYTLGLPPGNIDSGAMWGSYIGLLFLGATFVAVGLFASSVTDNQIVSFILAALISAFFYIGFEFIWPLDIFSDVGLLISSLGILSHYDSISRGVVDTRDLIYFISVIAFFLMLTRFSLASRKW
ncbi:MAG: gliding motility-associated ABC transporter permease subunit GldF [Bacteroidales bacterium]|jgi:ABC-2 type transport system permease protein|nr:gliding motility-associated ABC transporter permease subunit GldF [Bacteroidales bacterium]